MGRLLGGEHAFQLPRVGWRLLACENGASQDCIIVVVFVFVLFGTPLDACVCALRIMRACKLAATSTHVDLETWACAPQKSTYPGPGMNRTVLQIMLIASPPFAINT